MRNGTESIEFHSVFICLEPADIHEALEAMDKLRTIADGSEDMEATTVPMAVQTVLLTKSA